MDGIIVDKATGFLHYYNLNKGFGIIRAVGKLNVFTDYFFHISSVVAGEPLVGAHATFTIGAPVKGARLPALRITFSPPVALPQDGLDMLVSR